MSSRIDLSGASVLVCGGAGFIGSHVVEALLATGCERISVVDDFSLGSERNLQAAVDDPAVSIERVDCAEPATLERVAADGPFDLCLNLAVIPLPASLEEPRVVVDRNVAMTTSVCELGRSGGFRRLLQFSSSEVYGTAERAPMDESHPLNPTTPYAASKAATDMVALSYRATFGLEVTVLRPFNTFGPRQNAGSYAGLIPSVVNAVLGGKPVLIHGDGEQTRDYVHVSDVARAALAAAVTDEVLGMVINIGSGREHSVNEIVLAILRGLGRPDATIEHGSARPGDVRRLLADISLAEDVLEFKPTIGLQEGMFETVRSFTADRGAIAGS